MEALSRLLFVLIGSFFLASGVWAQSQFAGDWEGPLTIDSIAGPQPGGKIAMRINTAGQATALPGTAVILEGSVNSAGLLIIATPNILGFTSAQITGNTMSGTGIVYNPVLGNMTNSFVLTRSGGGGDPVIPSAPSNMSGYRGRSDGPFLFQITGSNSGSIWGTDIYTDDSSLAKAVVHAGVLTAGQSGVVEVTLLPGRTSYSGSTRNGVNSSSYGSWSASYSVSAPGPPVDFSVTAQPQSLRSQPGSPVTLSVSVSGSDLSYQWYIGDRGVETQPISGAITASYSFDAPAASTSYWVKITNASGSVASEVARLTIAPPEKLLAHYTFDGASPGLDQSGNGFNLNTLGSPVVTTGQYGNGIQLNGSSSGFSLSVGSDFQVEAVTLMAWVKPLGSGQLNPRIVSVGPGNNSLHSYSMILGGTSSPRPYQFFGHQSTEVKSANTSVQNSQWVHLAITYDGQRVKFFLNGQPDGVVSASGTMKDIGANALLTIGNARGSSDWFNGVLDEVKIYNYSLSEAQIEEASLEAVSVADPAAAYQVTVDAKSTGSFGSPVLSANSLTPAATFTEAGQQVILTASGSVNLGEGLVAGPEGVTATRAQIIGYTPMEEKEIDLGNITQGALPAQVAKVGALMYVFVPSSVADASGFVAHDLDVFAGGVGSSGLMLVGSGPLPFIAPGPGTLYLGINEAYAANNSGAFQVNVDPHLASEGLQLLHRAGEIVLTWTGAAVLQASPDLTEGSWEDVTEAVAPFSVTIKEREFFRLCR
ncbi:LamG-like jellyroll fold domain-containing protein [Haloferula chungangensis]|uniref:LamG-like jellyroll fold domain-containing protein n=1 Tax=Haloferula chungangensis TaxID=1048331 RepID=A0ABW2LA20_9BACT